MASLNSQQAGRDAESVRTAAAKLDDAFQDYANANGDGFSAPDFRGAYDYREEGYRLGEEARSEAAPEDRDAYIDSEALAWPESARYLIACAADYRLAELEAHAVFAAPVKLGRAA